MTLQEQHRHIPAGRFATPYIWIQASGMAPLQLDDLAWDASANDGGREHEEALAELPGHQPNGPGPGLEHGDRCELERNRAVPVELRAAGDVHEFVVRADGDRHEIGVRRPVINLRHRPGVEDEDAGRNRFAANGPVRIDSQGIRARAVGREG